MKLLITLEEIENLKSRDLIPIKCYTCNITFNREKHNVQKVLRNNNKKLSLKFCSKECSYKDKITKVEISCSYCSQTKLIFSHDVKLKNFCSRSCSNKSRAIPKPIKTKRILLPKRFCKCGNKIQHINTTNMCIICYLQSDRAMEQRGRTFSKTRKYKTNPFTKKQFYLMSALEEKFFDLCIVHNIEFLKPSVIKYQDGNKQRMYFPDFYLPFIDSIIEIKGYLTKEDILKMSLVKEQHSNLKIQILFKNQIDDFFLKWGD